MTNKEKVMVDRFNAIWDKMAKKYKVPQALIAEFEGLSIVMTENLKKQKEKSYLVFYQFNGSGNAIVDAKNEREALGKFDDGDFDPTLDSETKKDYEVTKVEEV